MLKPKIFPPESETPPIDVCVQTSSDKKTAEIVPMVIPVYPRFESFDVDVLVKSGISPDVVSTPIIHDSIDSIQNNIDNINANL